MRHPLGGLFALTDFWSEALFFYLQHQVRD